MSDNKFRIAERRWLSDPSHGSWASYLRESRRIGEPVFTLDGINIAVLGDSSRDPDQNPYFDLTSFTPTEDGFIADVERAVHPEIEGAYDFPISPDEFDQASFPLWGWWSGQVVVCWSDTFSPSGPTLTIEIDSANFEAWEIQSGNQGTGYVYERDYITNNEQLRAAFLDPGSWA
jgi:hypothetical protein